MTRCSSATPQGVTLPGWGSAGERPTPRDRRERRDEAEGGRRGIEPKDGGSHNVWVAGDKLLPWRHTIGGLRVLDISGELRGDLPAQDREIAGARAHG